MDHEMSGLSLGDGLGGAVEVLAHAAVSLDEDPAGLNHDNGVGDGERVVGEHLVDHRVELSLASVGAPGPRGRRPVDVEGRRGEGGRDQRQRGVSHGLIH